MFTSSRSPHPNLMLLETYTALDSAQLAMPDFLTVTEDVTGESRSTSTSIDTCILISTCRYSMFNLSKTASAVSDSIPNGHCNGAVER